MGDVLAVQMPDLAGTDLEPVFAELARIRLDPRATTSPRR